MKIEEKKLSRWVSIFLVLGVFFLILFTVRVEHHLDVINVVLLVLVSFCTFTGAIVRGIESIKIYRRALQALANGEEVIIY
jgi:UPF0716 family protein affecting phage T7 exclusion